MIQTWKGIVPALGLLLLAVCLWKNQGIAIDRHIESARVEPDGGHAYVTRLTSPLTFALDEQGDDNFDHNRSPTVLLEDGKALGPPHSIHDSIRAYGLGAYSHWGAALHFSTSDNTDPRRNGRVYLAQIVAKPSAVAYILAFGLVVAGAALNFGRLRNWAGKAQQCLFRIPGGRWIWVNVVPGVGIALALLLLVAGGGEMWIRLKSIEPFTEIKWPGRWTKEMSFTFAPHAEIQFTNHLDYWVRQQTNAYGFPDREWSATKPPGSLRVAFIGDSFVEALQVPIPEKSHVLFERMADRALAPRQIETAAFGISGTGQSNQVPFYDHAARDFRPDVVILVVVSNDFGNNSAVLECVRNGWNPDHLPRLFYTRKRPDEPFAPAPLDERWDQYLLLRKPGPATPPSFFLKVHQTLMNEMVFYSWVVNAVQVHFPKLQSHLSEQAQTMDETYAANIAAIRRLPGYEHSLDGWNFPDDWDFDSMFSMQHLAPVFAEAVLSTGKSLDEFKRRAERDQFQLVIFLTSTMSEASWSGATADKIEKATGNLIISRGRAIRFKELAQQRGIPVIDEEEFIDRHHIDPASIRWTHDNHWNPHGHEIAAEALLEAFQAHPEWLVPGKPKS